VLVVVFILVRFISVVFNTS